LCFGWLSGGSAGGDARQVLSILVWYCIYRYLPSTDSGRDCFCTVLSCSTSGGTYVWSYRVFPLYHSVHTSCTGCSSTLRKTDFSISVSGELRLNIPCSTSFKVSGKIRPDAEVYVVQDRIDAPAIRSCLRRPSTASFPRCSLAALQLYPPVR
jgi:hypothetical protein